MHAYPAVTAQRARLPPQPGSFRFSGESFYSNKGAILELDEIVQITGAQPLAASLRTRRSIDC